MSTMQIDRLLDTVVKLGASDLHLTVGRQPTIPYLGVISLGLFPNEQATVTATASAALIDTRSGYVDGVYEATARKDRLSKAWGTQDAIDAA